MGYHSCFQHYENIIDAGHFLTVHPLVISEKLEGGGTATPAQAPYPWQRSGRMW
jgi:hypothetical protein